MEFGRYWIFAACCAVAACTFGMVGITLDVYA